MLFNVDKGGYKIVATKTISYFETFFHEDVQNFEYFIDLIFLIFFCK